ncbi:MAG: glycerophosphodiester phosphodiesterase [Pseudonocardiaceae bacterium]
MTGMTSTRRIVGIALSSLVLTAVAVTGSAGAAPSPSESPRADRNAPQTTPLVIGHRGASGYRPEHTLAAYELAVRLGADYIEPDLVPTRDGQLVARHENEISGTTDVAARPEFADRRTTKLVDGTSLTGWFTEDFTLAELKTLRAKERIPQIRQRNTRYDGRYQVPTLQEVIDLAERMSKETGRQIGIYPETKHPTYFHSIGLALEPMLVRALNRNGLNRPEAKVFVQSFETANLRALNTQRRVPLVQLIAGSGAPYDLTVTGDPRNYADLITPAGLAEIAGYADGIGPDKNRLVPRDGAGFRRQPTTLVDDAHQAGLLVHPYTFRNENTFLPADFRSSPDPAAYGDAFAEYALFYRLGVDGLFSDNPDTAVAARG